jgi:hypothetical protein
MIPPGDSGFGVSTKKNLKTKKLGLEVIRLTPNIPVFSWFCKKDRRI